MTRNVISNLHQHSLVFTGGDNVAKHANQFVDPVTLLCEDLRLGEEVLRGLDLAVAPGEPVHVGCDRQHEPGSPEDVVVVSNIFVVVKYVSGCCETRSAAAVILISSTSA